jgi:hypothetical protein
MNESRGSCEDVGKTKTHLVREMNYCTDHMILVCAIDTCHQTTINQCNSVAFGCWLI